jgi:hypothetical protein
LGTRCASAGLWHRHKFNIGVGASKSIYNGDIGKIENVHPDAGEIAVNFDGRPVAYGLVNSTCWCRPTQQLFTRARDRNIRQLSSPYSLNVIAAQ